MMPLTSDELSYLQSLVPFATASEAVQIRELLGLTDTDPTVTVEQMVASAKTFRENLIVDRSGTSCRFGSIMDPWQKADFEAMDPALELVAKRDKPIDDSTFLRCYLERGRGHSKTHDIGTDATWLVWASPRKITGIIASGDKDQAKFVRDAIDTIYRLNPFLADTLKVNHGTVLNTATGSRVEVISSDAASSYGALCDFIICDELTHWKHANGQALWESLFSTAAKRETCLLLVIANAGLGKGTSWQWRVREQARTSDRWYFSRLDGIKASWMSEATLAEQRSMLTPSAFRRLWLNEWLRTSGDAIDEEDLLACVNAKARPLTGSEREYVWLAGLDIGIKKDRAAFYGIGADQDNLAARLAFGESWKPSEGRDVDLVQVEDAVIAAAKRFRGIVIDYDPHQCEYMAQRLRRMGVNMVAVPFQGKNCHIMATSMMQAFKTRRLTLYEDDQLIEDIGKLNIVEKGFGFKLEAPEDSSGHADSAMALAIAMAVLPVALEQGGFGDEPPEFESILSAADY